MNNLKTVIYVISRPEHQFQFQTRKSSCVNARGITTTAYQVLHLFPEVGYPPPRQVWWEGTWGGVPPPAGGTPCQVWWGVPEVGYPPGRGTPCQVWWGGTRGGVPPLARSEGGYLRWEYPPGWTWLGYQPPPGWTWLGYPPPLAGPGWGTPPPRCGQTDWWTDTCQNITFPRTSYAVGNNSEIHPNRHRIQLHLEKGLNSFFFFAPSSPNRLAWTGPLPHRLLSVIWLWSHRCRLTA